MSIQLDLFGTDTGVVRVDAKINAALLSKNQKKFNTLIGKINELKRQRTDWQDTADRVRERVASELTPLYDTYDQHRVELVRLFDKAFDKKLFKKTDRVKLSYLICSISAQLVDSDAGPEMKALHDKYSDMSLDEIKQEQDEIAKSMMGDFLGIDLPDDLDLGDEEQFRAFMEKKVREEEAFLDAQNEARASRGKRKKSAKQQQREAQQKAESHNIRTSLQDIFRKLAAALHPDREFNPTERERKTELMQRVNAAYGKKDLLQLLELQLEVEQIDQHQMSQISDERLKNYIAILHEQCAELQRELDNIQMPFKRQFQLPPFAKISVKEIIARLNVNITGLRRDIKSVQADIQEFQNPAHLKAWLKSFKIPAPQFDELDFF